jgi:hypothetical protein
VPSDVREKLGRYQIVEKLWTRDVSEAMSRRTQRAARWDAVFSRLRGIRAPRGVQAVTKAFGQLKRFKGFVARKKVVYLFRKTFITTLARSGAQEAQIAQTVGQEHNQITVSVYNPDGFPLAQCKQIVDQFHTPDFQPIDVITRSDSRSRRNAT